MSDTDNRNVKEKAVANSHGLQTNIKQNYYPICQKH